MIVVPTMAEARALTGLVGLVPTMGYFHEGHLSLMRRSVAECDVTVVSLFVNPLQFNEASDLESYPTDHDRDLALAEEVGVDMVVMPSGEEMYPIEPLTRVSVGTIGDRFEGADRPGHLVGVATVVTKLLAGMQPDVAYFGRKDAQQLAMVERLVVDLSLPVQIVGCPLVREPDGLALSSRNVRLGPHREEALGLSRGLMAAADAAEAGERFASGLIAAFFTANHLEVAYLELADRATMQPVDEVGEDSVFLVAAEFGGIRLIDNIGLEVNGDHVVADRGVRMSETR